MKLSNLDKQFLESFDSSNFKIDMDYPIYFYDWLFERDKAKDFFINKIYLNDLNSNLKNSIEFNKSYLDSISNKINNYVLTKDNKSFNEKNYIKVLDGNLKIIDNNLYIKNSDNIEVIDYPINTIVTHNPYNYNDLDFLCDIHNMTDYNIIIGLFGNITDKDYIKKEKKSLDILNKLNDDYIYDSSIYNNQYATVIASKKKILK